eukprot:10210838-Prorocentrum_lima.AAC.1
MPQAGARFPAHQWTEEGGGCRGISTTPSSCHCRGTEADNQRGSHPDATSEICAGHDRGRAQGRPGFRSVRAR